MVVPQHPAESLSADDAAIAAKGPEVEERISELQAVLKTIKGAAKK